MVIAAVVAITLAVTGGSSGGGLSLAPLSTLGSRTPARHDERDGDHRGDHDDRRSGRGQPDAAPAAACLFGPGPRYSLPRALPALAHRVLIECSAGAGHRGAHDPGLVEQGRGHDTGTDAG